MISGPRASTYCARTFVAFLIESPSEYVCPDFRSMSMTSLLVSLTDWALSSEMSFSAAEVSMRV